MTVVVVMGVRRAGPRCGPSLEGKDGAVRRRRRAGLGSHLLIGGQLQGSQETCSKIFKSFFVMEKAVSCHKLQRITSSSNSVAVIITID